MGLNRSLKRASITNERRHIQRTVTQRAGEGKQGEVPAHSLTGGFRSTHRAQSLFAFRAVIATVAP
jgi:hypothetical protein